MMPTTTSDTSREVALARAVDRWNAGDLDGYLALYADDVLLHGAAVDPLDKDGVRAFYEGVFTAFPGCRLELHDAFGVGDRLAARFTVSGRHAGEFMGIAATGREVTVPGITILRFRGDACVERWTSSDQLGLLVQLGAVPPPG